MAAAVVVAMAVETEVATVAAAVAEVLAADLRSALFTLSCSPSPLSPLLRALFLRPNQSRTNKVTSGSGPT